MIKTAAVIGLGSIAARHRNNLKRLYPEVKVIAMSASGRTPTSVVTDADELVMSMAELLSLQPDFVVIASPASCHVSHTLSLLDLPIPLLIEKPLCADVTEAAALVNGSLHSKATLAVAYCLRFLPCLQQAKSLLEDDAVGQIYNISATVGQYLPDWRPDKDYRRCVSAQKSLGGGALLELSHEFDYLQWLTGTLQLQYAQLRHTVELGLEVEEIADLLLTTKNGAVCNVHLDFVQKQPDRRCSIIGSKGRLEIDLLKNQVSVHNKSGDTLIYAEPDWDKNQMYLAMMKAVVDTTSKKGQHNTYASVTQAMQTVTLIQQIKQQAIWGATL